MAESANGVKYLYDISPIKKVGPPVKSSSSTTFVGQPVKSGTSTTGDIVAQDQTESQAQIRSSTLSDRDVLRIAAQMAKNSESMLDIKKEKVISSPSFSARGRSEVFEPKPSQTQYTQDQTESQAQIRSSTLSDRDVLRIAAQMAKNSESRSLTDADRSAPLNFGYHEAKHLIQSCFIQIETVSVLQCVLPCFLFRISIFNHQRHRTGKYTNSEERSICGNEKFFPVKINRAVFCREGSFHFG